MCFSRSPKIKRAAIKSESSCQSITVVSVPSQGVLNCTVNASKMRSIVGSTAAAATVWMLKETWMQSKARGKRYITKIRKRLCQRHKKIVANAEQISKKRRLILFFVRRCERSHFNDGNISFSFFISLYILLIGVLRSTVVVLVKERIAQAPVHVSIVWINQ